jgi:MarR family 2-MHQ and catechol resistance regulon transcriptional repressor
MGTHYAGTRRERDALNAYIALMRASETVSQYLHPDISAADLAPTQLGVLDALFHLGPMCQRDLGRKILRSPGNITTVIDNLERRNLVRRRRAEVDRRYIAIHLTPTGRSLIERFLPTHVRGITEAMGVLSREEQKELADLCRKLGLTVAGRREDRKAKAGPRTDPGVRPSPTRTK